MLACAACDTQWGQGAGELIDELPRKELVGCYGAGPTLPALKVTNESIFADGEVLHTSYEYGSVGRNAVPVIRFVPNGTTLERQLDATYAFVTNEQGVGGDASYRVNRQSLASITIVSGDGIQHDFKRVACS